MSQLTNMKEQLGELLESVRRFNQGEKATDRTRMLSDALGYAVWVAKKSSPKLLSDAMLEPYVQNVRQARSSVQNLESNPNAYAAQAYDQLRGTFALLNSPWKQTLPRSISKSDVEEFEKNALASVELVRSDSIELQSKIQDLEEKAEVTQQYIQGLEASSQQLQEYLRTARKEYESEIRALTNDVVRETAENGSSAISNFKSVSTQEIDIIEKNRDRSLAALESAVTEVRSSLSTKATDIQQQGQTLLEKIRNLYNIAGRDATAGGMIQAASEEQTAYKIYSSVAGGLFFIGAFVAWDIVSPVINTDSTLTVALSRIALTSAIFLPAWYVATIATKHRRAEVYYRSAGVRMAAFDPYIVEMDEEDRQKLRVAMADIFFANPLDEGRGGGNSVDIPHLEKTIDTVTRLADKVSGFTRTTK